MSARANPREAEFIERVRSLSTREEAMGFFGERRGRGLVVFARHVDTGLLSDDDLAKVVDRLDAGAPLIANPSLPDERLGDLIERRARGLFPRPGVGGEGVREMLDAADLLRARSPRARIADLARDALNAPELDEDTKWKWAVHLLCETFEFRESDARLIVREFPDSCRLISRVIEQGAMPVDLMREIFDRWVTGRPGGGGPARGRLGDLRRSLAASPAAYQDERIRRWVISTGRPKELADMAGRATPEEVREMFTNCLAQTPQWALAFLEGLDGPALAAFTPSDLAPLLEDADRDCRLRAQLLVGRLPLDERRNQSPPRTR